MTKNNLYFSQLFIFAYVQSPSYSKLAHSLSCDLKGPAVQHWTKNGVPHKWRPVLDEKFGEAFRAWMNAQTIGVAHGIKEET